MGTVEAKRRFSVHIRTTAVRTKALLGGRMCDFFSSVVGHNSEKHIGTGNLTCMLAPMTMKHDDDNQAAIYFDVAGRTSWNLGSVSCRYLSCSVYIDCKR